MTIPRNKKKSLSFCGIKSFFQVRNANDIVHLEQPFLEANIDGERHVLSFLLKWLNPGDVAYDIGAYLGVHTVFMAKRVGKNGQVVAFEPETQSYEALVKNLNLNSLENVTSLKVALGAEFGEGVLYYDNCFNLMGRGINLGSKVKIVPGDYLVKSQDLPLPKVVKIDVEGCEYYVIYGLQNTLKQATCKTVCCEIHSMLLPSDIKPQMVIDLLKSFGFTHKETHPRGETFHVFFSKS
jgi:FkbM family methyltransferase